MSRKRALRLVLAEAGAHAAIEAQEITGKSINDLPEYFLSVFIARHVHQHFKTFTFSMEDTVKAICASEEDMSKSEAIIKFCVNMTLLSEATIS